MPAHQPSELHVIFREAFNRGDVDALAALYESGATLVVNGEPVTGVEHVRAAIETWLAPPRGLMRLDTRAIIESPAGFAVLHGTWTIETVAGASDSTAQGVSTEVARRQEDGTWRFVIDCPHSLV